LIINIIYEICLIMTGETFFATEQNSIDPSGFSKNLT